MRRLIYQVYVGPRSKLYDYCVRSFDTYCAMHGIAHIVQTKPLLKITPDPETSGRSMGASRLGYLPIFEKENALAYLDRYDRVAVVDADVWARPGAPDVFEALGDAEFGAVVERDMPLTEKYLHKIRGYSRGLFGPLEDVDWRWDDRGAEFANMGIMVMAAPLRERMRGQTPAQFLARPGFKRFVDGVGKWKWSTDQVLLNWWLRKEGVPFTALDWRWNGLYGALEDGRVQEAHFVHFFLRDHLPQRGENVEELAVQVS